VRIWLKNMFAGAPAKPTKSGVRGLTAGEHGRALDLKPPNAYPQAREHFSARSCVLHSREIGGRSFLDRIMSYKNGIEHFVRGRVSRHMMGDDDRNNRMRSKGCKTRTGHADWYATE
jgi:hypothetical protein